MMRQSGRDRYHRRNMDPHGPAVQVGAVYPGPRSRSGTAPCEYIKAPGHRIPNARRSTRPGMNLGGRYARGNGFQARCCFFDRLGEYFFALVGVITELLLQSCEFLLDLIQTRERFR